MDNKKTGEVGFSGGLGAMIKEGFVRRREDSGALLFDALIFIMAFLFAGCHIAFGAYPLGVALVAVLPRGVWLALVGAVVGSLSLGKTGVIHAVMSIIVVFLRIIISGGDRNGERAIFREPLILRISAAAIGAFVGAVYVVLLGGFAFKSVLYGLAGVLLSAVFTFAFAGILDGGVSFSDILSSRRNIFAGKRSEKEKFGLYLFQGTFLLFAFLISISLKKYNILGISLSYIFSVSVTLFVARRFGIARAIATGFVSSLGISTLYSVAFAFVGLGAGLLASAGIPYMLIGGGVLLSFWSAYSGGATGFLSTFPEYVTAALLSIPLLRKLPVETKAEEKDGAQNSVAQDMVATTALAYKSAGGGSLDLLEGALSNLSPALRTLGEGEGDITYAEYRDMVIDTAHRFCHLCHFYNSCVLENPAPCAENMDLIATKLYKKEKLFPDDITVSPKYCHNSKALFDELLRSAGLLQGEKFKGKKMESLAEEYELIAKLLSEARSYNESEKNFDAAMSEKLSELLLEVGLTNGAAKVFGTRRKHFILAGEDKDGSIVTSPELRNGIEKISGVKLGTPEYYRKGDIALFECSTAPMYTVEFATAGKAGERDGVSGDTAISFESGDGHFYSLISDGMGSGEGARRASVFTAEFLSSVLNSSCTKSTAFHILNHILKNKSEECSATVDLFDFDLMTGEAVFFKCGAVASYVKRDSSIFRIRSETAPLGLMKNIDAERVRVEVKSGDYIVMLSDGVSQSPEDATWLLELLNAPPKTDIREYADFILSVAEKYRENTDDMSLSVMRVFKTE